MNVSIADIVERVLRDAGVPIDGVSANSTDRETWRIDYSRAATPEQRAQGDALAQSLNPADPDIIAAIKADRFGATSRQQDHLATMAVIVRASNPAAWNAMTLPQKLNATLAAADVWQNIREFIESNT